jgi:hypothetical protein
LHWICCLISTKKKYSYRENSGYKIFCTFIYLILSADLKKIHYMKKHFIKLFYTNLFFCIILNSYSQYFTGLNNGVNGSVNSLVADTSSNMVYAGGTFTAFSPVSSSFIAKWNGTDFFTVGGGVSAAVTAFCHDSVNDVLYIGGTFTSASGITVNRIVKWDGTNYTPLGSGMNNVVNTLVIYNGELIAGGTFTTAGGLSAPRIARWDGTSWKQMGSGLSGAANALISFNDTLYVGGAFITAGGKTVNRIAKWDGSAWWPVSLYGMNNVVRCFAIHNNELYAGGSFTLADSTAILRIAKWDGNTWQQAGNANNIIYTMYSFSGNLYAGGAFTNIGGVSAARIAFWDGSTWKAMGTGTASVVNAIVFFNNQIHAGGAFTSIGGVLANRVARWDGTAWNDLGTGANSTVNVLSVYQNELYLGGSFTTTEGSAVNRIAAWDGSTWSVLGSGMNNSVLALEIYNGNVFAGGSFTTAGGNAITRITQWDGTAWVPVSSGTNNTVNALYAASGNLYAGGAFTTAGGVTVNRIAFWDGSIWNKMATGVNGTVNTIVEYNSEIYIGGSFVMAGTDTVNRVARWDGTKWNTVGVGFNNAVNSLAVYNGELYAGGTFTKSGTATVNRIAKWDGSNWVQLLAGANNTVNKMINLNGELYAGGAFTTINGKSASRIAHYDGTSWYAIGSGVNNTLNAFTTLAGELYLGGSFVSAGGLVVNYIAKHFPVPEIAFDADKYAICPGDSISFIDKTFNSPVSWEWSFPGGSPSSSSLQNPVVYYSASGIYDVTLIAQNANGKDTLLKTNYITVHSFPDNTISVNDSIQFCYGDSAVLIANGKNTYLWNSGETDSSITVKNSGIYFLTITSPDGCSLISDSVEITVHPLPVPVIASGSNTTFCAGDSVSLSSNFSVGNIWNNGDSIVSIVVYSSGSFFVQVTDSNNCVNNSDTVEVVVNSLPLPGLTPNGAYTTCNEDSILLSANSSLVYLWSTGDTAQTLFVSVPGNYSLTVTDLNNCSSSDSVSLTKYSGVTITGTISESPVLCFGNNSGEAVINVSGGTQPYSYLWGDSVPQTDSLAFSLYAGTYSVTVTDVNNCVLIDSVVISEPLPITFTDSVAKTTCFGKCDGYGELTVSGGVSPYSYSWPSGETGSVAVLLCGGAQVVTVTDANMCLVLDTLTILQPGKINFNVSPTDVSCFGSCNGKAIPSVFGGTPPYIYSWDNPCLSCPLFVNVCAGSYVYSVTDSLGCVASDTVVYNEPTEIITNITSTPDSGSGNGTASVIVTGGVTPYSYNWNTNPAQTTSVATGLTSGTYTVVVTDSMGCKKGVSIFIEALGINETDVLQNISLYPNPVQNKLYIKYKPGSVAYFIPRIYNILGQEQEIMYSVNESTSIMDINTEKLEKGAYVLWIYLADKHLASIKFVK